MALALSALACSEPERGLDVPSDVRVCREHLERIYRGLLEYRERFGHAPTASGTAFFGALIADGVWEADAASLAALACPGKASHAIDTDAPWGSPARSSYAGRDNASSPLPAFPSGGDAVEPLVACDGAKGPNHGDSIQLLYSDGSIRTYSLAELVAAGTLPAEARTVPLGPESPIAELRKLVPDPR